MGQLSQIQYVFIYLFYWLYRYIGRALLEPPPQRLTAYKILETTTDGSWPVSAAAQLRGQVKSMPQ